MSDKVMAATKSFLESRSSVNSEMRQLELSPDLLRYHKSVQKRFRNPIVEVRNGVCLGCFIGLSSGQKQEIENGNGYGVCEACGRILYFEN
jgi:predicted  nucleic acid-binding Zn-ribbon protein